jgi:hypothetical protein
MTPEEIRMCVADSMQDDEIENVDSILRVLNGDDDSWGTARGSPFSIAEVRNALEQLITEGLVLPCADDPTQDGCCAIPASKDWKSVSWDDLWFHLEEAGRDAVRLWWGAEGQQKYPLEE